MSKEKHRPKIYVAGPLSSDPINNTYRAIDVGNHIYAMGGDPFIPHLSYYRDARMEAKRPYGSWIAEDLRWLAVCDALYRIPGESKGADIEVAEAERLGMRVFYDLDALRTWVLTEGTPEDNEMRFCPKCGRKIAEVREPDSQPSPNARRRMKEGEGK